MRKTPYIENLFSYNPYALSHPSRQKYIVINVRVHRDLNQVQPATGHPISFLIFLGESGHLSLHSVGDFDSDQFQFAQIHVLGNFSAAIESKIVEGGFCVTLGNDWSAFFSTESRNQQ